MSAASLHAYGASAVLLTWGAAHLLPTRAVADGFGNISQDNRRVLVMEWIAEGIMHISIPSHVAERQVAPAADLTTTSSRY